MKIIVHSALSAQTISVNLGKAEYSYYFVLAGYMPALRQLGDVVMVDDPEIEADAIYDAALAAGEDCVFICFAPPHLVPITLRCPTIPVVAWEFTTIPCEMWSDDPRSDWRVVFAHCKRVIALSGHTAALVREAMGADFPVFAIPTATYELFADTCVGQAVSEEHVLRLRGYLFDSAADARFLSNPPWPPVPAPHFVPPPPVAVEPPVEIYAPPPVDVPPLSLPPASLPPAPPPRSGLRRRVSATIYFARAWYHEVLRDILPGPVKRLASLGGRGTYRAYRLAAALLAPEPPAPAPAPELVPPQAPLLPECEVTLRGVVYVSVLAPQDGRKNWQDMLSGFVWTFKNNPDATLFLKMPVRGGVEAYHTIHWMLTQFSPFKCRVICFAGFLDDAEYRHLIRATDWYLNTSHGEGLCLPLMEFLSAGVPAIAPRHTAMADYIDNRLAFVLRTSLEHNVWPFDPRDLFTTMRHRLNWQSLNEALEQSFALTADAARYTAMREAARAGMRAFCALDVVQAKLAQALGMPDTARKTTQTSMVTA